MRIAVVCVTFPAISETFILRQITGLIDLGHDVTIFADDRPSSGPVHRDFSTYRLDQHTVYADIPGGWRRVLYGWLYALRGLLFAPRTTIRLLRQIRGPVAGPALGAFFRLNQVLRRRLPGYDVVHCHQGYVANNWMHLAELWKSPLVVSFHGADFSVWPRLHGVDVYRELFGVVKAVTVNSGFTRRKVEALGARPDLVVRLPVGLNPDEYPFRDRGSGWNKVLKLVSVGRLVEKKGMNYLLEACAVVARRGMQFRLDIAGDGPLRETLEDLSRERGISDRVFFHGAVTSQAVRDLMQAGDIFVLASVTGSDGDTEGQGLVLQEAQATGMPIVATDHNGFPDSILPGRSGYLVPEKDVDALAERILWLGTNPGEWGEMGKAGRQFVDAEFDIRKLNTALASIYSQACARNNAAPL